MQAHEIGSLVDDVAASVGGLASVSARTEQSASGLAAKARELDELVETVRAQG